MKLEKIGLLMTFVLVAITMSYGVQAAACDAALCTPTCSWTFPDSNNYDLGVNTAEGNTTLQVLVSEGTTSGFYNVTMYTISPYRNSTNVQNTSENSLGPVIFSDLDDGVYKLDAVIFYGNVSNQSVVGESENMTFDYNLSTTQAACDSRYVTVDTTEGSIIPVLQQTALTEEKGKTTETAIVVVILLIAAYLVFIRKK